MVVSLIKCFSKINNNFPFHYFSTQYFLLEIFVRIIAVFKVFVFRFLIKINSYVLLEKKTFQVSIWKTIDQRKTKVEICTFLCFLIRIPGESRCAVLLVEGKLFKCGI